MATYLQAASKLCILKRKGSGGSNLRRRVRILQDGLDIVGGVDIDKRGVGGEYSLVACLSNLTIDQASLSRQSTVPTPESLIKTPSTFGRSLRFFHIFHINCLRILSSSCFAVCGHHLPPRIAIVCLLLYSLPNSSNRTGGGGILAISCTSQPFGLCPRIAFEADHRSHSK